MIWLRQSYIKLSEICKMLYGSKHNAQTSKFMQKLNNAQGKKFNPEEQEKLEQIRKQIINDLNNSQPTQVNQQNHEKH